MKVSRTSRLNGEYQKEISVIIRRLKDKAPDIKGLISVTEADVAPDLKTANIYVSIYGANAEDTKRTFEALQQNAGYIRHELAQVMRMRTVPSLTFKMDGSMSYGSKMDEIFKGLTYSTPEESTDED